MSTAVQQSADIPASSGNRQLLRSLSQEHRAKYQIYVSNLVYTLAPHSLEDAFDAEGCQVAHVELIHKGKGSTKTGAGLAVMTMKTPEDKIKAMQIMDGKLLFGRPMIVRDDKFV